MNKQPLLELRNVCKNYKIRSGSFQAIRNVSLSIFPGETLGLVGESGCGKTTLGKLIVRLEDTTSGSILFKGMDIVRLSGVSLKSYRRNTQMVFQDPYSALNPRMRIRDIIREGLKIHKIDSSGDGMQPEELIMKVGLNLEHLERFPHELSGGQRQRVGIARALALKPQLIVLDEPLSALDLTVQVQILHLLKELQESLGLSYLMISHDIGALKKISHRIAEMRCGEVVEIK